MPLCGPSVMRSTPLKFLRLPYSPLSYGSFPFFAQWNPTLHTSDCLTLPSSSTCAHDDAFSKSSSISSLHKIRFNLGVHTFAAEALAWIRFWQSGHAENGSFALIGWLQTEVPLNFVSSFLNTSLLRMKQSCAGTRCLISGRTPCVSFVGHDLYVGSVDVWFCK